jgi:hypothetical protein
MNGIPGVFTQWTIMVRNTLTISDYWDITACRLRVTLREKRKKHKGENHMAVALYDGSQKHNAS